ncbi:hypothetical protein NS24R_22110, partial [Enterobacter hormaechei subsp. xiangfangensis]
PTDILQYSLEPMLIETNREKLDDYAKITLSTKTFNIYDKLTTLDEKIAFLKTWYNGDDGAGKKKVDSAIRIFDSEDSILYPHFFKDVFNHE